MKTYILEIASLLLIIGGVMLILLSMDGEGVETVSSVSSEADNSSGIQVEKVRLTSQDEEPEDESLSPEAETPKHIRIPAIKVDAPVIATGLNENNEMIVPDNGEEVAWFAPGREPGKQGNAVLAGHVDDYNGPAVFFDLEKLQPEDEIQITDENNVTRIFVVDKLEAYPLGEAPLREVFGPEDDRKMNLLTCTGLYNVSAGTHEERLVVYTTLKQ